MTMSADDGNGALVRLDELALQESFDSFYGSQYPALVRVGYVLAGSWAVAEDLAQDAFVKAYDRWEHVGGLDDPAAWLRRVVANAATSRWRRLRTELKFQHRFVDDPVVDEYGDGELWAAVRRLPRRQAQAIALRFVVGLGPSEIASTLGCSVETARTHLKRAKETLAITVKKVSDE